MRFEGLPGTPAEHAYERFLSPSVRPGVVDNQYMAWIFDFGLVGVGLCLVWIGVLLSPMFARARGPALVAARLTGVFLLVGAVAVDIWEEAPTDLVAAVFFALAVASVRPRLAPRDG
jgi:O-antigen ligase